MQTTTMTMKTTIPISILFVGYSAIFLWMCLVTLIYQVLPFIINIKCSKTLIFSVLQTVSSKVRGCEAVLLVSSKKTFVSQREHSSVEFRKQITVVHN